MSNTEHRFADPNRHVVEVPNSFAIARWPRDADVPTIARCILGTLKYEPHSADTTALPRALERVIEHECHSGDTVGAHALVRAMVPPCWGPDPPRRPGLSAISSTGMLARGPRSPRDVSIE